MVITYYGKQFFKITQGETTIAFNPIAKSAGGATRFGADLVLSSIHSPAYNGLEQVTYGDREPFIIDGPGDYEAKGIFIKGAMSESDLGGKPHINTIFSLALDGMSVGFLGALSSRNLSTEAREVVGSPDILFVPIGGEGLLAPDDAYKLALSFEPTIIIPMDFGDMKSDALKRFLKEGGQEDAEIVDKLTLKRKDLEGKNATIIVLEPLK